jgi:PAS domain-containing protein
LVLVGSILSMIGYGLELITPDLPGKLLFVQIRYLGTALATPAFVLSALWYAGRERWLTPRYVVLIALLPALSESLFLFNNWHHLHYVTVGLDAASGFPQLIKTNGPLYWLYIIHSLVYVILAAGVTLHTLLTASRSQRRQAGLVFAATSIPLVATLIYLAGLRPYGFFNFTPLAFSITGLTLGLAIFRYKLLDLRPIAYRAALDRSLMGVIVLDRTRRIADLNRAAQMLLNVQLREALDQPVSQVSREWPALTERLTRGHCSIATRKASSARSKSPSRRINVARIRRDSA